MSLKTIIVHVDTTSRSGERVKIAAQLAMDDDAHLIGLATTGWSSFVFAMGAIDPMVPPCSMDLEPVRQDCRTALAAFEAQARALGVASVETRLVEEEAGMALALHGRYSDLIVLGQTRGAANSVLVRNDFPEYVLLNCATPVLVVPASASAGSVGRHIAVAWNGSMEARRAIASAIPVLQRARQVSLVIINPELPGMDEGDEPGADMALYLARQGIRVEVLCRATQDGADEAIIDAMSACGADMIVMGAYGRSRLREFIMGGVTRTMLESMTVPAWMAH
ncbi:universal stress protein [Massilia violaceinigra]|uniref:Universal stress protein n=1 Tax=Massilia violaceinigra TaxID=2045208 RepID=A0ABY4A5P8_9BURK|nr:universal stress protein [Massilia violaceinigra]UOD28994.1 universal stress protein [Massilia violaceinigra]